MLFHQKYVMKFMCEEVVLADLKFSKIKAKYTIEAIYR